jgi:hypothetical protein
MSRREKISYEKMVELLADGHELIDRDEGGRGVPPHPPARRSDFYRTLPGVGREQRWQEAEK